MSSPDSLKVIHICEDARGGGQFQYILDIATDSIYNYSVVCPQLDDAIMQKVSALDVTIHPHKLQIPQRRAVWSYLRSFNTEVSTLAMMLEEMNPDLVVCHGAIQVKGVVAAYKSKVPSVWVMHDSFLGTLSRMIFKRYHRYCDHFIFVSERSKEFYNNSFPKLRSANQVVIPSSIDHSIYAPGSSYVLSREEFHVITTCYINKWKGLELLIDIAHAMQQEGYIDIKFHIVGPILKSQQSYAESLLGKISSYDLKNLSLHGYRSDIPDYLQSSSIYLCTSTHESSPLSVWEAMATGLPIVSSDVGDMTSIVRDSHSGIVINDRNATSYADAILLLKGNDDLRIKYGHNALRTSQENFSKHSFQEQHRSFYQKVANS